MLIELKKVEVSKVAGGDLWGDLGDVFRKHGPNKQGCMGEGRIFPTTCYDEKGKAIRSWKAKDKKCATWFCCSEEKGTGADHLVFKDFDGPHNVTCPSKEVGEL